MIRLKIYQHVSTKVDYFKSSFSFASPTRYLSSALCRLHNDIRTSSGCQTLPYLCHRRQNCDALAQQPAPDPRESCRREKPHSWDVSAFSQLSITPFRFEEVNASTSRVEVLEQWRLLLEHLKTMVDEFDCTVTAIRDVSGVRQALERHQLLKLLIRPYSYTADIDALTLVPHEPSCGIWDLHGSAENGGSFCREEDRADGSSASSSDAFGQKLQRANKAENLSVPQRSCVAQLELESLRAVMVLSNGLWEKDAVRVCWRDDGTLDGTFVGSGVVSASAGNESKLMAPNRASPVMLYSMEEREGGSKETKQTNSKGRPNRDQLSAVQDYLASNLPKIFEKFHSYDIYTNDLVFENNWYLDKSYVTVGIPSYALEIAKLRLFIYLRYANVKMQLLKATTHEEDGSIRIRWRISGIPQAKAVMFWKFLPWGQRSSSAVESEWLDGLSTFFVEGSGLICKHKMDRVIPDEGPEKAKNPTVIEKLGIKIVAPAAT